MLLSTLESSKMRVNKYTLSFSASYQLDPHRAFLMQRTN
nr:MAG TPA: hypothetical protein [Caudoviricetes sp.]